MRLVNDAGRAPSILPVIRVPAAIRRLRPGRARRRGHG